MLFFLFHKPLPPAALSRLWDLAVPLFGAGWILWISIGIGWSFLRNADLNLTERTVLSGALGFGVLSLQILGLAALGWISGATIAILLGVLTVICLAPALHWISSLWAHRAALSMPRGAFSLLLLIFCLLVFFSTLATALAPPAGWDALVYHLRIPQQILAVRSLNIPGDSFFRGMPEVGEMLFTAGLGLTGLAEAAAVISWCAGLLTLIGLAGTSRRMEFHHTWLAPAILLAGDSLARGLGESGIDWFTALFGFAAVTLFSQRTTGSRWIFLGGIFAGLAFGAKYTAGALLPVLAVWLFLEHGWKRGWVETLWLGAGFLTAFSPWLARNLVLWGNPLPPLLDGGVVAALRLQFFSGGPLENGWYLAPILPFLQSVIGRADATPFSVEIGPLILLLLPGVILIRQEQPGGRDYPLRLLWLCLFGYWLVSGIGILVSELYAQSRFFLVFFPALALLASFGFEGLHSFRLGQIRVVAVVSAMVTLTLVSQGWGYSVQWAGSGVPAYVAGVEDRIAYLEGRLGWYARAMADVRAMPEDSRVLTLWEPRGFYCETRCWEDATIDRWYLAMRLQKTPAELIEEWTAAGFTHVLVFTDGSDFERQFRFGYSPADWFVLTQLRRNLAVEAEYGTSYTLYRLLMESSDE